MILYYYRYEDKGPESVLHVKYILKSFGYVIINCIHLYALYFLTPNIFKISLSLKFSKIILIFGEKL
jgi:hypothetical protein